MKDRQLDQPFLSAADRVAFYLVEDTQNLREMRQSHLEQQHLEEVPLIAQKDIISYSRSNQSIILTDAASNKLQELRKSGGIGRTFAACVNGKPIYFGKVWTDIQGAGCSDIVLIIPVDNGSEIHLQAGYPSHSWFVGHDYRSSNLIIQALKRAGKLRK